MKKVLYVLVFLSVISCAENLMKKPDDLIPRDTMLQILEDLAIVSAAKATNVDKLREHEIEPMEYIYSKYGVDSLHFAESDLYYASLPDEYELIYKQLETRLEERKSRVEEAKKIRDSLSLIELEEKRRRNKKIKDSLP